MSDKTLISKVQLKHIRLHILLLLSLLSIECYSQDPQFSQLYSIPLYMGPSFAGSSGGTRVGLNFRDQWPAVDKDFISYSLSADHFFAKSNNGIGLLLFRDHSGMGKLTTTSISLQYAYAFNITKELSIRPGLQFTLANRQINYSQLVFGDQISLEGTKPASIEPSLDENKNYIDFGSSLLLNHNKYWLGVNFDHINRPNQSLNGQVSRIPLKLNIFGGFKFVVKKRGFRTFKRNVYAMFQYKMQEEYKQAYLGFYWENNNIITGIWYRGIPFTRTWKKYLNNDAAVFLVGYKFRQFSMGYSYDFTVSRLAGNSAGSHEVSLVWTKFPGFGNKNFHSKKSKKVAVSCPTL